MKQDPLVSVIMAAYNHEKYISDAINSVLNQTYENIEIIVEDDCSTDSTAEKIKKIKDKRLKKIYSKKNKGAVATMNHLVSLCNGDYIAILGSDDVWYPNKIEVQLKQFKDDNIGAVFSLADIIDENGERYEDDVDFSSDVFKSENMSRGKRMRKFFEIGNHLCHPSSIIPKKVMDEIGPYNEMYRQLHDFDYWVRIVSKYDIAVVDDRLLGYRRFKSKINLSNSSISSNIRVMNEHYNIIKKLFNIIPNDDFIDGFSDLFRNKKSSTNDELFCEKFLILKKINSFKVNNKQLALDMLFDCENTRKITKLLEEKYNYSLNDFYKETGELCEVYPFSIVLETKQEIKKNLEDLPVVVETMQNLQHELNSVYNSKSWKITKPIRKIMEWKKYGKH